MRYFNLVDKIRHINDQICCAVDELTALRAATNPASGDVQDQTRQEQLRDAKQKSVRLAELKCDISEFRNRRRQRLQLKQELSQTIAPAIASLQLKYLDSFLTLAKPTVDGRDPQQVDSVAVHAVQSSSTLRRRRPYSDAELSAILKKR